MGRFSCPNDSWPSCPLFYGQVTYLIISHFLWPFAILYFFCFLIVISRLLGLSLFYSEFLSLIKLQISFRLPFLSSQLLHDDISLQMLLNSRVFFEKLHHSIVIRLWEAWFDDIINISDLFLFLSLLYRVLLRTFASIDDLRQPLRVSVAIVFANFLRLDSELEYLNRYGFDFKQIRIFNGCRKHIQTRYPSQCLCPCPWLWLCFW